MEETDRRTFLKGTAVAVGAAATQTLDGWTTLATAAAPNPFEAEFGINDRLCGRVLERALAKGGDFADLYFEHTLSNWLILEDGKVNQAYGSVDLGVGIRTVKGDQVGYAFTQELTESAMLRAAATAASIADQSQTPAATAFVPARLASYYPFQKLLSAEPLQAKLPLVQGVNDRCFALSQAIVKVNAWLYDQQKSILIVTSDGRKAQDLQPRNYLSARVVAEKNGRREQASWNFGGRRDLSFYTPELVERLAKIAVERVSLLFEAVAPPAGEMPVVFGPGLTGILLHEAIGHGMEADFNRKGISTFATMIGRRVAEPSVTIVDDATNPDLSGSLNVDDEGNASQRNVLIEDGILRCYIQDSMNARLMGVAPTGNGRRESYASVPMPRMTNTYMLAGDKSKEEILAGLKRGLYATNFGGGQVDITSGKFVFSASEAFWVENGKIQYPVKGATIIGNGPDALTRVSMIGNDMRLDTGVGVCGKEGQSVPVGVGQPTLRIDRLTVGGTA